MSRILLSLGAFMLTLAACLWATVALCRGPIEQDLTQRSLEALASIEGLRADLCGVAFVGRDGQVWGEVQSQRLKDQAEQRLRELYGARLIRSKLAVRPFDAPWIMVERNESGGIHVAGLLPEQAECGVFEAALAKSISSIGDQATIDWQVETRDKVGLAPWLSGMGTVAGSLVARAEAGRAQLRGGKLSLQGEMPDRDSKDAIAALVETQFGGEAGLAFDLELTVAPPPEPSRFEMFPPNGRGIAVAGRLADLESAEQLLSLLRTHAGDWIIQDQIVVAENTTPAPWIEGLTFLLPSILNEVEAAGVKVEGSLLRIDGQISEEMFVAISEVAGQNFPAPDYEVQNRLRLVTPPREAMVSVVIFPGDPVRLKGLLAEEGLKQRVVKAVRETLGDGSELLTDELQVDSNVMAANWIDGLVGLIPPYVGLVKRGGLTIYSDILAANAVIDSDAERDLIWAMTEQFFPDDKYRRLLELQFPEEVDGGIVSEEDPPEGG